MALLPPPLLRLTGNLDVSMSFGFDVLPRGPPFPSLNHHLRHRYDFLQQFFSNNSRQPLRDRPREEGISRRGRAQAQQGRASPFDVSFPALISFQKTFLSIILADSIFISLLLVRLLRFKTCGRPVRFVLPWRPPSYS